MPYTPPAQSPRASPCSSRSSSFSSHDARTQSTLNLICSNNPPRSATYLHKQRRSSITGPPTCYPMAAQHVEYAATPMAKQDPRENGSLHQSPPPVTDNMALIPTGAVLSPPDSTQNSSDEEEGAVRRGRDLGKLEDELKEAIKGIPHRRYSPDRSTVQIKPVSKSDSGRGRSMHQRSRSENTALGDIAVRPRSDSNSSNDSDMEDDAYRIAAPPMIRKKSGEVVKSSLKSPSRSRPCSMPSTPTFPKNVHFDSSLEHVRHFLYTEKPSAVSVGSSPVENSYDAESEYPFGHDDEEAGYELILPNFPKNLEARKSLPVRLEKVCMSTDKKNLIATVAVVNISFQKHVVARFTFDYWQTVSEVTAEWNNDVRRKDREEGIDRFVFKIKLAEQKNLEKKTLFFCIRYNTAGQEFWDNNGGCNFQVDFKKTSKPTTNSAGPRLSALPRSKPTVPGSSRPRSMPNMDEFEDLLDDQFMVQMKKLSVGSTGRAALKSKTLTGEDDSTILARRANPSGNAFGNRYDFRTSLDAAIKASTTAAAPIPPKKVEAPRVAENPYFSMAPKSTKNPTNSLLPAAALPSVPLNNPSATAAGPPDIFNPDNFWTNETGKPSIESPSYRELLDNYCFFGSSKNLTKPLPKQQPVERKMPVVDQSPSFFSISMEPSGPEYTLSPPSTTPPSLSIAQQKSAGNASPIPVNYAGFHHRRRASGAFRFDAPQTPTAIC